MTVPKQIEELEKIRDAYVCSMPGQRLNVIAQRLANPSHEPNFLVTAVSAVEALARSLAMHARAKTKTQLRQLYGSYRDREVKSLISEYLASKGKTPVGAFGKGTWRTFGFAVSYRNMLVHECTYLGQDKGPEFVAACQAILQELSSIAGLRK